MSRRLGPLIIGDSPTLDKARLFQYMDRARPFHAGVVNNPGLWRDLRDRYPTMHIVPRLWEAALPDENVPHRLAPDKALNRMIQAAGRTDFTFQVNNESGWTRELVKWWIELMDYADTINVTVGVGATANGTDSYETWLGFGAELLHRLSGSNHWWIEHQYYCVVPTSGLYGGFPDNAGAEPDVNAAPGTTGLNLLPMANWPEDVSEITCWHIGRHKDTMLKAADTLQIPRRFNILVGEAMADWRGDIGPWASQFDSGTPGKHVDGVHSLRRVWEQLYPDMDFERVAYEAITWADRVCWKNYSVAGALLFCWR